MRHLVFVLITIVCSVAPAISEPSGVTKITLTWTDSFDRIEPQPQKNILLQRNSTLVPNNGKTIDQRTQTSYGGAVRWDDTFQTSLGKDWRVVGPNVLRRTIKFPNDVQIQQVTVNGNTCTLTITIKLANGAPYYIRPMISQPGKAGTTADLKLSIPFAKLNDRGSSTQISPGCARPASVRFISGFGTERT
jgi:hypothetical protein